jgi:catechol 2,3-dioxygenase-like lactoylglutathione lyase family enzyme
MKSEDVSKRGIPTATNIDHAGYTVPNLDEAVTFFADVLGCDLLYTAGPYEDAENDSLARILNVHPRASVRLAVLRCGPYHNIELVEFKAPDQDTLPTKLSDAGGRHLAFHVTDLQAAASYLKAQSGLKVLETISPDEGEEAGVTTTYFTTPWGMYMELITRPEHMPYEEKTDARLFGTALSWNERPDEA